MWPVIQSIRWKRFDDVNKSWIFLFPAANEEFSVRESCRKSMFSHPHIITRVGAIPLTRENSGDHLNQLVLRPSVLLRKRICLMEVALHFIADDGDGWREHEDNEANCHINAHASRNDGEHDHRGGPGQQQHLQEVELSSKVIVKNVD